MFSSDWKWDPRQEIFSFWNMKSHSVNLQTLIFVFWPAMFCRKSCLERTHFYYAKSTWLTEDLVFSEDCAAISVLELTGRLFVLGKECNRWELWYQKTRTPCWLSDFTLALFPVSDTRLFHLKIVSTVSRPYWKILVLSLGHHFIHKFCFFEQSYFNILVNILPVRFEVPTAVKSRCWSSGLQRRVDL
jgi:hypothetical protein